MKLATLLGGIAAFVVLLMLIWLLFRIAGKIGKDLSLTSLDVVLVALGDCVVRNSKSMREKSLKRDSIRSHELYAGFMGAYALIFIHMFTWMFIYI